jgi:hypothetical protein
VKYCWEKSGRDCDDPPSKEAIKAVLFKFTQGKVPGEYFFISGIEIKDCCVTFTVTFSIEKGDEEGPDPDEAAQEFEDSIAGSDSLSVVKSSDNSSSFISISTWLLFGLFILTAL